MDIPSRLSRFLYSVLSVCIKHKLLKSPYIGPRNIAVFKLARMRSRDEASTPILPSDSIFNWCLQVVRAHLMLHIGQPADNPSREKNREDGTSEEQAGD